MQQGLRRRAERVVSWRAREITIALNSRGLAQTQGTGIALVLLGIEQLEALGHTRGELEQLLKEILDTPVENDIRAHTGGT